MSDVLSPIIRFIGDSHTALTFGQTVSSAFQKQHVQAHFLGFSGLRFQYMTDWEHNPDSLNILNFEKFPNQEAVFSKDPKDLGRSFSFVQNDVFIIALGTNDIVDCINRKLNYKQNIFPKIDAELKKLSAANIIYVEPPLLKVDSDLRIRTQIIQQLVERGSNIVSCGDHSANQNDGIHMKKEMAISYGNFVAKELLELILPHH